MRLSFGEAGLDALDALGGLDAVCLPVFDDERPLGGLAGWVDWRLCGALSRVVAEGRFVGGRGDALLLPSGGRLPVQRVFCFGFGPRAALDPSAAGALVRRTCEAMGAAGSNSFATELPRLAGAELAPLARTFIAEGAARFRGDRIVLLGDGRALVRAFQDAAGQMKGLELDREPLAAGPVAAAAPAPGPVRGPGVPRVARAT